MNDELELVARFREGDRAAFHKLARRHHVGLINFFHSLLGGRPCAAEVLTEQSFVRVCEDVCREPHSSFCFKILLYRAAYKCWLMQAPAQGRTGVPAGRDLSPHTAGAEAAGEPTPPHPGPSECESESASGGVLLPLPGELKPVLVLKEVTGLCYAEIAAVLAVNKSSVKSRIQQAYNMLGRARACNNAEQEKEIS